jgi:glycosyltransferase involved in cell wall biosynthesis
MPSTVVTVHDSYQNFKLRNRLLWIPVFATFRRIVCCGQASLDSFPALYKWLAGERLGAVPNGLDIARVDRIAAQGSQLSPAARGFTVLAVSRLVDIKNPSSVLAAFQQSIEQSSRPSRLVYIGDGPLREKLQAQRGEAGLEDAIELTGLIPREKVFEHLLAADLFVSTSRGEGLPVAVLEAMACGCPVLLSDIPPHREIADGVDFVPLRAPDDVAGFAQEIDRLGGMPASERANIGQKGRKLVEERFSLQAMHAGYTQVYAQITNGRGPLLEEVG